MPERNMKTVLHIAGTEFKRWLRSSRIIILGVMLIFVHMQIIVTLQDCASRTGLPVSVPEAFVALGNSGSIVLILPALFLVLMSDFPQKSGIDFCIRSDVQKEYGSWDRSCLRWKRSYSLWCFSFWRPV